MTSETLSQVRARLAARRPARGSFRLMVTAGHGSLLVLFATAALSLLLLSAPRFAAQALLLPASEELDALKTGTPLTPEQLAETAQALARARALDPGDGRLSSDLALVELRQADQSPADRRGKLEAALADLERSLAEAPANSFAWARLAGAHLALEGAPSTKMLAALRMSYTTGLYADKIMPFRAGLTLSHWNSLDAGLTDFAKRELIYLWERRGAWEENQLPLIKLLCETGRTGLLAQVLIEGHRSLVEFDKLYPTHLAPEACAKLLKP